MTLTLKPRWRLFDSITPAFDWVWLPRYQAMIIAG
jgi:hypothetical protein